MDAQNTTFNSIRPTEHAAPVTLTVRGMVDYLLGYRWWIVIPTIASVAIVAVVMLLTPNKYTSSATILPSGQTEGVSSLKDLVGLGSMGMVDENSSQLYPLILHSQQLKTALLSRTYSFRDADSQLTTTLAGYFKETDPTRLSRAIDDITTISTAKRTGELVLQTETTYPAFSQLLANAYLEELETFNRFKRATTAGSNQRYLEKQLAQTTHLLDSAEENLESFRRVNSDWAMTSDAQTLTQLGRLQREVEMQSTALLYLRQQYEAARLTAQKDVPIVRVLDYPNLPTLKSGPQRTRVCLVTGLLTMLAMIFGLFGFAIVRGLLEEEGSPESPLTPRGKQLNRLTLRRSHTHEATINQDSHITTTAQEVTP